MPKKTTTISFLTTSEIKDRYGIPPKHIRKLVHKRKLRVFKISEKRWLIPIKDLEAHIEKETVYI